MSKTGKEKRPGCATEPFFLEEVDEKVLLISIIHTDIRPWGSGKFKNFRLPGYFPASAGLTFSVVFSGPLEFSRIFLRYERIQVAYIL